VIHDDDRGLDGTVRVRDEIDCGHVLEARRFVHAAAREYDVTCVARDVHLVGVKRWRTSGAHVAVAQVDPDPAPALVDDHDRDSGIAGHRPSNGARRCDRVHARAIGAQHGPDILAADAREHGEHAATVEWVDKGQLALEPQRGHERITPSELEDLKCTVDERCDALAAEWEDGRRG
jgi:hypothetical protein